VTELLEGTSTRGASGMRTPTFTAVVCAYTLHRWDDIVAAIDSLQGQTRPPDEIILVSDHNDSLLARAGASFFGVRCVANSGARGLSDARNTGVSVATGDIVGFLDDDAVAGPRWVEHVLAAYEDDDVLGVGGAVVPAWPGQPPAWFPDEFLWVVGCSYTGLPQERAEIRNPIGANMSFRRSVLDAIGGFDAGLGRLGKDAAGCEETELSIRARAAHPGGRVLYEPNALCRHTVSLDRVDRGYFRRRCQAEGRSKALVAGLTGQDAALSSERTYVSRTLPVAVLRGLRGALAGDASAAARVYAIVEGLALTSAAYALATVRRRISSRRDDVSRAATA
jgi:GT2 family glycosyltransferase